MSTPEVGREGPRHRMVLRSFRSMKKGALLGFASVALPIGLVLVDLPLFIGKDGSPWAALPRKPVLDTEGRQKIGPDGKPVFQAVVEWRDRYLAERFSDAVCDLVRVEHPGALDGTSR